MFAGELRGIAWPTALTIARFECVSELPILGSRSPAASHEAPTAGTRADHTICGVPRPVGRPGRLTVSQQESSRHMYTYMSVVCRLTPERKIDAVAS